MRRAVAVLTVLTVLVWWNPGDWLDWLGWFFAGMFQG